MITTPFDTYPISMQENEESAFSLRISPSVSKLVLHAEEVGECYLEFLSWEDHTPVRVTFKRCLSARMLAVGGENTTEIEILSDSDWLRELNLYQQKNYPSYPDNFKDIRHFCYQGHDAHRSSRGGFYLAISGLKLKEGANHRERIV